LGWKETRVQDERMKFIMEVEAGEESMAELCRAYGVSRKTGYKWLARYHAEGVAGLADRSRAPDNHPNAIDKTIEETILALRAQQPTWGERKLRQYLESKRPEQSWPSASTIGALLQRHGLTHARRPRRRATPSTTLSGADEPNQVWAIDFKGHFPTGDGVRCDPLTISDTASRYLLRCQRVARPDYEHVRPLLEATFREFGLPLALRSDNGPPFASVGLGGLSRLSVWCIRLGVLPERIEPGHPEQNGRHERLHRTLKQDTAQPPKATGRAQQRAFNRFRRVYNEDRPHEALDMRTPASVYAPSPRRYPARLPESEYPDGFVVRRVQDHGDVRFASRRLFLSEVLTGEFVGLQEDEQGWRIWFGPVELARLDHKYLLRALPGRPPRIPSRCLERVCARPSGSLRRAPNTAAEKASETEPSLREA